MQNIKENDPSENLLVILNEILLQNDDVKELNLNFSK